jgi:hypothetical protein
MSNFSSEIQSQTAELMVYKVGRMTRNAKSSYQASIRRLSLEKETAVAPLKILRIIEPDENAIKSFLEGEIFNCLQKEGRSYLTQWDPCAVSNLEDES